MRRRQILTFCTLAVGALWLCGCHGSASSLSVMQQQARSASFQCVTAAPKSPPIIAAHRGGAGYAPENTLPAFNNAVRLGVDQLEMDTQLTADGKLVVIHDDTLDRTTNCSGAVDSKTLAQIQACDAAYWFSPGQGVTRPDEKLIHPLRGRGITVPRLSAVLDWYTRLPCPRPGLSIEIKNIPGETNFDAVGDKVAKVLLPMLRDYGVMRTTIVQSFWPLTLAQVNLLAPDMRTQYLTSSGSGETAAMNLAYVLATGQDIVAPNSDAPDLLAPLVLAAHAAGKLVLPYTPDSYADQQKTLALGADGVITNFPACTFAVLGRPLPARIAAAGVPETAACPDVAPPPAPNLADRPDAATCSKLRPARWHAAIGHAEPNAALRVIGIQYKQAVGNVVSYASFRTKMRCLMQDQVLPLLKPGLPTLVVFNEDIGLMTLAIGSRGAAVRALATSPLHAPLGDQLPAAMLTALGLLNTSYAPQILAYQTMFPAIDPRKQVFVAATDTFVRAFMQTFSAIARDYGVYVVASNNMAPYRVSTDPLDILLFKDSDLGQVKAVYVATSARVTNSTFLWGPRDLHPAAPTGATNLLLKNEKVPLTSIEKTVLGLDAGPATGAAAKANAAGFEVAGFHLGFATSLPAFQWGYDFGQRPDDLEPCKDLRISYMPCMNALGVDVVVQAEANPGRWAVDVAGGWQPLEWMNSTWRSVADPTVGFAYNITAMLTGNLLDLPFDGQSAITSRRAFKAGTDAGHYVGNLEFAQGTDKPAYQAFVGDQPGFVALAPWVTGDADRGSLAVTGTALSPGSGKAEENDYLETAVWADLTH